MKILDYFNQADKVFLNTCDSDLFPYLFRESYAQYLNNNFQHDYRIIFSEEQFIYMPIQVYKNKFLNIVQILFPPLKNGERLPRKIEVEFLESFIQHLKGKSGYDRIVQPSNYCIFHGVPCGTTSAAFGTYFLDLEKYTEDELFARLHSKHRNVIRNSENKGGVIKYGIDELPVFYKLYQATMKRSGMYCEPFKYFEDFYKGMTKDSVVCAVVYHNGSALGALLMPYSRYGAYYLYGASADEIPLTGAINYLHWQNIKLMKSKGVIRYDFVGARLSDVTGSKLDGIQEFKLRFGCELERGFLWKIDLNGVKCKLYDLMLRFKLILKGVDFPDDIITQENRSLKTMESTK